MLQSTLNLSAPQGVSQPEKTYLTKTSAWAKRRITTLLTEIQTLRQLVSHPCSGFSTKIVAACSVAYLLSPLQLIPSFIPVIGQLDDLLVVYVGMKLVRRMTPPEVLTECENKAQNVPSVFSFRSETLKESA